MTVAIWLSPGGYGVTVNNFAPRYACQATMHNVSQWMSSVQYYTEHILNILRVKIHHTYSFSTWYRAHTDPINGVLWGILRILLSNILNRTFITAPVSDFADRIYLFSNKLRKSFNLIYPRLRIHYWCLDIFTEAFLKVSYCLSK